MVARRLLSALLLALLISGAFTFLLARHLLKPHTGLTTVQYVTTTKDLDVGEILTPEDLKPISWPATSAISGAVLTVPDAAGRAVLNPLVSGQPILVKQLSAVGGVGLSAKIPAGMRAISLKSDQVVGVAGFLLPGTHIDVLVTYRNPASADAVTATVLQNAEVIAAGQKTQPDPEGKPSTVDVVTLLVTPPEAERVVLASTQGTVHFVLRNGADRGQTPHQATDIAALGLGTAPASTATVSKPPSPVQKPAGKVRPVQQSPARQDSVPYSVFVTRGDKQTVETF